MAERFLAIEFVHPDFDSAQAQTGLRVNPDGSLATVDDAASIRQSILMLLSTRPGERVMRPDYGSHLHRLLFAPNDATTAGLAIHYVRRALERWERRIDIMSLDAVAQPEDTGKLSITLEYRIRSAQQHDRLSLTVDLLASEI